MAEYGLATLGVEIGYGTGSTKPTKFTRLTRVNQIGGVAISPNSIDASALEDFVDRAIAGRASTGGNFPITINVTDDTIKEWETVMTAYKGLASGSSLWFEVVVPKLTKGFFIKAQMPDKLPLPQMGQNSLLTMEISTIIEDYVGLDTKVALTNATT